ncbi:MAG: hypothetical protein U0704_00465 [Candidatus Eisenbacteria bacterium]
MKRWWFFFVLFVFASWLMVGQASAQQAWNSITLNWTTPGDDSLSGTASQFDIRYSTSPITAANFASATRWTTGVPTPTASGTRQTVVITGLNAGTTYYVAMKTADEVPNWAGISNVVSRTTAAAPDLTRPAALALGTSGATDSTVVLTWSATGDDSLTGTATSYDVRYSTSPITEANWASATTVTGEPTPTAAGTSQTYTVRSLSRQVTYYFAAKVSDEAGNTSALSNVLQVTTPDTKPPAAITDLVLGLVWLNFSGSWAAPPRLAAR